MRSEQIAMHPTNKPTRPRRWALLLALAGAGAAVSPAGCRARAKNFDNENDALRRQLLESRAEAERLRDESAELRAKLGEAVSARDAATGPSAEVVAAMPRCTGIEIRSNSGWTGKGSSERGVEVLVQTFDARKRFVQVAGTLIVDVTYLPVPGASGGGSGEAGSPVTLGSVVLSPADLREAYRSSFMGTHYAVVVPTPGDLPVGGGTVVVRAVLRDGVTGASHEATRLLK